MEIRRKNSQALWQELAQKTVFDWWTMVVLLEYENKEIGRKTEEQKAEADRNDREIDRLVEELGLCSRFMAPDCRDELLPVYLGAEAISIFNKIGLAVSGKRMRHRSCWNLPRDLRSGSGIIADSGIQ